MPSLDFAQIYIFGGILFAGTLIFFIIYSFAENRMQISRRLASMGGDSGAPAGLDEKVRVTRDDNRLKAFEKFISPANAKDYDQINDKMIRAGLRNPSSIRFFYIAKAALSIGFIVLSSIFIALFSSRLDIPVMIGIVSVATLIGFVLPTFWLERRIAYRRQDAELGFPDTLDMLLVCVEAGHGLDQALRRVSREIRRSNPTLSDELTVVGEELLAGKDRQKVLRAFSDRLKVDDISAFITILNQSDAYGVSIADSLRVYAAEMRNKRIMKAEATANAMPLKLALGSIGFTVPPIALIMAGPSFIMIARSFAGMI